MRNLEPLMAEAVAYATKHVQAGGLPFVAQVIDDGRPVLGYGTNQVLELADPAAHAEIVAIRVALTVLPSVAGMSLLATGEPCGMCYQFAADHGIADVFFAVSADDAARRGFDYRDSYRTHARGLALRRAALLVPTTAPLTPFLAFDNCTIEKDLS